MNEGGRQSPRRSAVALLTAFPPWIARGESPTGPERMGEPIQTDSLSYVPEVNEDETTFQVQFEIVARFTNQPVQEWY